MKNIQCISSDDWSQTSDRRHPHAFDLYMGRHHKTRFLRHIRHDEQRWWYPHGVLSHMSSIIENVMPPWQMPMCPHGHFGHPHGGHIVLSSSSSSSSSSCSSCSLCFSSWNDMMCLEIHYISCEHRDVTWPSHVTSTWGNRHVSLKRECHVGWRSCKSPKCKKKEKGKVKKWKRKKKIYFLLVKQENSILAIHIWRKP
mgnify:CR=1 FL=1